jgi:hypothetical protein
VLDPAPDRAGLERFVAQTASASPGVAAPVVRSGV